MISRSWSSVLERVAIDVNPCLRLQAHCEYANGVPKRPEFRRIRVVTISVWLDWLAIVNFFTQKAANKSVLGKAIGRVRLGNWIW
jgi:hypothetical protein